VPELNVQNGVLKSLSLFEYIGEMGKDYIYAVTPLLEDALMDCDLVHRQTAASIVKHMALGVPGLGCEDALIHLLNFVWLNIFETSPHVIMQSWRQLRAWEWHLDLPFCWATDYRVCSILRGKCEKFTGGFTTRCTLVHKMV
jgi:hypothetical protein